MSPLRSLVAAWDAASPSRRVLLTAFAIIVVLALALSLFAAPLDFAIARGEADVARSRLVLAIARERLADSAGLARESPVPRAGDLRTAVERVLARHTLQATPAAAPVAGNGFSVVIANGRFDVLVAALEALSRDEGVRVVGATLTARVEPGAVRAELTFVR